MTDHPNGRLRRNLFLAAALLQAICGIIFIVDVAFEIRDLGEHAIFELIGVIALILGAFVSLTLYRTLIERTAKVERELGAASGAFQVVVEEHFRNWQLTDAERDVALLSIKGSSVSDIAEMRHTRAGTIRAQCAAIYRKSGVSNRAELVSVMIEELIAGLNTGPKDANRSPTGAIHFSEPEKQP